MPFREGKISEKIFGEKAESRQKTAAEIKAQVPPEERKEGGSESERNAMIRKVAKILREEREDLFGSYEFWSKGKEIGNPDAVRKLKEITPLVEGAQGAEKDFLEGNWNKQVRGTIEYILRATMLGRPSDPSERRQWEEKRRLLVQEMKKTKVSKEEIAEALGKKEESKEESKKEKSEK